jgi:hypothetical protein
VRWRVLGAVKVELEAFGDGGEPGGSVESVGLGALLAREELDLVAARGDGDFGQAAQQSCPDAVAAGRSGDDDVFDHGPGPGVMGQVGNDDQIGRADQPAAGSRDVEVAGGISRSR